MCVCSLHQRAAVVYQTVVNLFIANILVYNACLDLLKTDVKYCTVLKLHHYTIMPAAS